MAKSCAHIIQVFTSFLRRISKRQLENSTAGNSEIFVAGSAVHPSAILLSFSEESDYVLPLQGKICAFPIHSVLKD